MRSVRAAPGACAVTALLALVALAGHGAPAAAQSRTGTAVGQFMLIEPSARFTAIGNAGVALDGGLDGAYYNPGAVSRVARLAFLLTHADWLAGIRYDYVAAAIPLGDRGTGFVTVTSLNSGEIDVRTVAEPLGTGERYTVSDIALGLGFARPISDRFGAGVQVKYVQETIWHSSANAVTFDVGSVYRIRADGLHIGSSITNFGTSARFSGRDLRITYDGVPGQAGDNSTLPGQRFVEAHPVPVLFRVGVGLPWRPAPDWRLWFSADAHHPNANPERVNAGVEATFRDLASLRIGYQGLLLEDAEEGLALGAGFRGQLQSYDYRVDYAWSDHGRLGNVHRITLALLH